MHKSLIRTNSASKFKLLSEIHFSYVLIFENVFRRARGNQATVAQYVSMAANAERFSNIVVSNQYADVALT